MEKEQFPEEGLEPKSLRSDNPFRDDEESSRRLGELYQDLNDFTETKRKIEELIRFRQNLIDQEDSDFLIRSEEFRICKSRAIEAINHLFDVCKIPPAK